MNGGNRTKTQTEHSPSVSTHAYMDLLRFLSYLSLSIIPVISGVFAMFGFYFGSPSLTCPPPILRSSHTINWDSIALWRIQRLRAKDIKDILHIFNDYMTENTSNGKGKRPIRALRGPDARFLPNLPGPPRRPSSLALEAPTQPSGS